MCTTCGDRDPGRRFGVDGTSRLMCRFCLRDQIMIAWSQELVRRVHFAAHGHDDPCPACAEDAEIVRMRAEVELDEIMARIPWPPA